MLGVTWAVIIGFTGRFFWRVLTLPERPCAGAPPPAEPRR
jgi:hypothetical protein